MQKVKLVLTFFVIMHTAVLLPAQDNSGGGRHNYRQSEPKEQIIEKVEESNKRGRYGYGSEKYCPNCTSEDGYSRKRVEPAWPRCLQDLCGGIQGQFYKDEEDAILNIGVNEKVDKEIRDLAVSALKAEYNTQITELKLIRDSIKAKQKIKDAHLIRLHSLAKILPLLDYADLSQNGKNESSLNKAKTRAAIKSANIEYVPTDQDLKIMIGVMNKVEKMNYPDIVTLGASELKLKKSNAEVIKMAQEALDKVTLLEREALVGYEGSKELLVESGHLKTQLELKIKNGEIDPSVEDMLANRFVNVAALSFLQSDEFKAMDFPEEINMGELLNSSELVELDNAIESLESERDTIDMRKPRGDVGDIIQTCVVAHHMKVHGAPTAAERKSFLKRESAIRTDYIEQMRTFLSAESHSAIKNQFKDLKLLLPPSAEETTKEFKESLSNIRKNEETDAKSIAGRGKLAAVSIFGAIAPVKLSQYRRDFSKSNVDVFALSETKDSCLEKSESLNDDAAIAAANVIRAGEATIKHNTSESKATLFHEYSHIVYDMFSDEDENSHVKLSQKSKGWKNKTAKCLSKWSGRERTEEEDWADMLAAQFSESGSQFLCSRLPLIEKYFSLKNKNDEDKEHSSYLFRLLHIRAIKGVQIPGSCQEALANIDEEFKPKNCLVE